MKRILQTIMFLVALTMALSRGRGGPTPAMPGEHQVRSATTLIGDPADQSRDEEEAIAALAKIGVPLERDGLGRVLWIEAVKGELSDEEMRLLPALPSLEWLEIGGGKLTAASMVHLKSCTSLRRLYVHDVRLSDDALANLSKLPSLEALSLQRTGITGKGVKHLKALSTLAVLNLSGNDIGDEGLEPVTSLKGLEVLALQNTKVTGAALARIEGMARLNVLNLTNCRIVDEDLGHFASMPNLRIVYAAGCNLSNEAIEDLGQELPMLSIFP